MALTLSLTSTFRQSDLNLHKRSIMPKMQNKDFPRRYLILANLFLQVEKSEKSFTLTAITLEDFK